MKKTEQDPLAKAETEFLQLEEKAGVAPRWAAIIGVLAIGVLYAALPGNVVFGPGWLLLVIEVVFLLPLVASWAMGRKLPYGTIRILVLTLLGVITLALVIGIALLVYTLSRAHAITLLRSAGLLWAFNILLFALWYWELDGGGPIKRHQSGHQATDFLFPQQVGGNDGTWAPHFMDYVFLAFNSSTALSPADTYPLTRTAKALMMMQAIISLVVIVLLAARAVNILGS